MTSWLATDFHGRSPFPNGRHHLPQNFLCPELAFGKRLRGAQRCRFNDQVKSLCWGQKSIRSNEKRKLLKERIGDNQQKTTYIDDTSIQISVKTAQRNATASFPLLQYGGCGHLLQSNTGLISHIYSAKSSTKYRSHFNSKMMRFCLLI